MVDMEDSKDKVDTVGNMVSEQAMNLLPDRPKMERMGNQTQTRLFF